MQNDGVLPIWEFAVTGGAGLKCRYVFHAVCGEYDNGAGIAEKVVLHQTLFFLTQSFTLDP